MKQLKEILKKLIENESQQEHIIVKGNSLEDALNKACEMLEAALTELDYEIIEFGNKGVFGIGKKDFTVKVYKSKVKEDFFQDIMASEELAGEVGSLDIIEEVKDRDSEVFLRVVQEGVILKISKPIGKGKKASEKEVINIIESRGVTNYDITIVRKAIKECNEEYTRVGEMPINVVNDSSANVQISSDKMKAYLILTPPKPGGFDLELDELRNILKNNSVVVGIKEDILTRLIDYPIYNEPILIAEGLKTRNGRDAEVSYNFNTEKKIELHEEDGKVDFKNLNIVQNVVAGQILATKEPATEGEAGRTVTNEILPARPGKDIALAPGKNTALTEDGLSIVSEKNGQVNILAGKVNVDEVLTIPGDVNLKVGNITFLGNVIIQGNIEDGFSVAAQGNIEVHGSVGKCNLDAEGDIIVSQGIMGKNEGTIRTGKNLYAKFIENVKYIDVGEGVHVQDGIMHSFIDATKEIACVGKRATIVGGRLRSGELVKSKTIGSTAGTETIIEVGIDPKKRQKMVELNEEREAAYKEIQLVEANFHNLENQKKQLRDKFPPEKLETYNKLKEEINHYNEIISKTNEEIEEINQYLSMLKNKGKIIASKVVHPQVKLYIKNAFLQIRTEYKKVEFVLENEEINVAQYTETEGPGKR